MLGQCIVSGSQDGLKSEMRGFGGIFAGGNGMQRCWPSENSMHPVTAQIRGHHDARWLDTYDACWLNAVHCMMHDAKFVANLVAQLFPKIVGCE